MGFSTVFLVYGIGKGHVHARSLLLKLRFDGVRTVRGFSMFRFDSSYDRTRYASGGGYEYSVLVVYDASGAQSRFAEDGRCGR